MRQCHRIAESALITITSGRMPKARLDHVGGMGDGEGRRSTTQITEDEAGAGAGGLGQRTHHGIEAKQGVADHGQFQKQQGDDQLQRQGAGYDAPAEGPPVLRQRPSQADYDANAKRRLQMWQHDRPLGAKTPGADATRFAAA